MYYIIIYKLNIAHRAKEKLKQPEKNYIVYNKWNKWISESVLFCVNYNNNF